MKVVFDNVRTVEIIQKRWTVAINITLTDGTQMEFVASADSGDSDGAGIWFGTRDEHEAITR